MLYVVFGTIVYVLILVSPVIDYLSFLLLEKNNIWVFYRASSKIFNLMILYALYIFINMLYKHDFLWYM